MLPDSARKVQTEEDVEVPLLALEAPLLAVWETLQQV